MPDDIFDFSHSFATGFTERNFVSCTPNRDVAMSYAGSCACELRADEEDVLFCSSHKATLFEISAGALDGGASLAWVSQYPHEDEYCLAAGSYFEVTGMRRERHVNVYQVLVRSNCCGRTLEELNEHRKRAFLEFVNERFEEAHQLLVSTPVAARVFREDLSNLHSQYASLAHKYTAYGTEWFDSIANYQDAFKEVFSSWRSVLDSSAIRILSWLKRQKDSLEHRVEFHTDHAVQASAQSYTSYVKIGCAYFNCPVTWSATSTCCILEMHEIALAIVRWSAVGSSGADAVRVLKGIFARFLLKHGDMVGKLPQEVAKCWRDLAHDAQGCQEYSEALSALQQELALHSRMSPDLSSAGMCETLCRIAEVHQAMGQNNDADRSLEEACRHADVLESRYHPAKGDLARTRAVLHMRRGQAKEALRHFEESLRIKMVHLSVQHGSVQDDLKHIRGLISVADFDRFKPRFRALERIFWVVVHASNPYRASSDDDLSLKEVVDYMRAAKKMSASAAEWGCAVLCAAIESVSDVPHLMGKVSLQGLSEAVCSCMQLFCGNELVQEAGLSALLALSSQYSAILVSPETSLDLDVVCQCMAAHRHHAGIQEQCLRIFGELMKSLDPTALQHMLAREIESLCSENMAVLLTQVQPAEVSPRDVARDAAVASIAGALAKQVTNSMRAWHICSTADHLCDHLQCRETIFLSPGAQK
jgi:tetratricopeptide (TPR) repeat protein